MAGEFQERGEVMIAINKKTGKDISSELLKLMQKKITNKEFEKLAGIRGKQ